MDISQASGIYTGNENFCLRLTRAEDDMSVFLRCLSLMYVLIHLLRPVASRWNRLALPFLPLSGCIGQGLVGYVFHSQQLGLVLKVGSRADGSLQHETRMYRLLESCHVVPKFYGHYYCDSWDVLVLEYYGVPLSPDMWPSMAEYVFSKNFLSDANPDNLGVEQQSQVNPEQPTRIRRPPS
jgi:hypothetical protein